MAALSTSSMRQRFKADLLDFIGAFDTGQLHQVLDDGGESVDVFVDDRQKSPGFLPVIQIAGAKRLHKPLDGRQRRLDLMGNGGGKITPHVLQAPQLSHVAEHHQPAQTLLQGVKQGVQ
jgi:hypothetical protein